MTSYILIGILGIIIAIITVSGNRIAVKTLDLNCDFAIIAEQLDKIAATYFS